MACHKQFLSSIFVLQILIFLVYCKEFFPIKSQDWIFILELSNKILFPEILFFSNFIPSDFQQKSSELIWEFFIIKLVQFLHAFGPRISHLIISIFLEFHMGDNADNLKLLLFKHKLWHCQKLNFKNIFEFSIVIFLHSLKANFPSGLSFIVIFLKYLFILLWKALSSPVITSQIIFSSFISLLSFKSDLKKSLI